MLNNKLGLMSIILLGVNAIIGTGIFLLPGKAAALVGVNSLWVIVFDALLVMSIALCFAEMGGMFNKNGGPYVYAKEAFGNFVGFEVGFMKWAIATIAWSAMAVGFATALGAVWEPASTEMGKNIIATLIIVVLGIMNIMGVKISKIINNIVTIGKLLPLIFFILVGIFYVKGVNFAPMESVPDMTQASFGAAALIIFYAFTGFESIAVAAEDMEKPERNVPKAIILVLTLVSIVYILIQAICIGIMGDALVTSKTPVADAAFVFMGPLAKAIVTAGTLISIGGINVASSFLAPRSGVAMSDDGLIPKVVSKRNKKDAPYVAIIVTVVFAVVLSWTGSFEKLAAISVVSRFAQYLPTCLAVLVFRSKRPDMARTFRVPLGPVIPVLAVVVSIWLITQSSLEKVFWGLGGLVVGAVLYYIMNRNGKQTA
ncbi:APC family permease [Veillonella sp. 3310]|uniref:APC family permease n=1 Tax=Veillonella sp. 3310 TaxID=2490956 RepID=UPI000FD6B482|nr:APC family permease [Veillonella sp. 3310]